ncbi:MAG: hypothetical protein QXU54_02535 [Candidatus Micrarchaeia archaeon]
MPGRDRLWASAEGALSFYNQNIAGILPFCLMFLVPASLYVVAWYVIGTVQGPACFNGDYIIELLFCTRYLGMLGKHAVAVFLSAFTIVPFAALVHAVNNIHMRYDTDMLVALRNSMPGLTKILLFRAALTVTVFLPFIIVLLMSGDVVTSEITAKGVLTLSTMLTPALMPLTVALLLGFALTAMLEPVFQYVEYEVLLTGARVRNAIWMSYSLAMRFKKESFIIGMFFVLLWAHLLLVKHTYLSRPELCIGLLATIFIEGMLIFPLRTITLYNLWKELNAGYVGEDNALAKEELKSYTGKMLLG